MITLDPALDKLRSKELSFGCLYIGEYGEENTRTILGANVDGFIEVMDEYFEYSILGYYEKIIGHPLTRGRIQLLMVGMEATLTERIILNGVGIEEVEIVGGLYRIFKENTLYDQDELQRQQHEKRPELRELLVKFAEYI